MQSIAGALLGSKIDNATKPLDDALEAMDSVAGAKAPVQDEPQAKSFFLPSAFQTSDMKVKAKLDARKKERESMAQQAREEYQQKLGIDLSGKDKEEPASKGEEPAGMWGSTSGALSGAFNVVAGTTKKLGSTVTGGVTSTASMVRSAANGVMSREQGQGSSRSGEEEAGEGRRERGGAEAEDSPPQVPQETAAERVFKSMQSGVKGGFGAVSQGAGKLQTGIMAGSGMVFEEVKSGGSKFTSLFASSKQRDSK